ncbi:hypothetical protein CNMCM8927_009608 [Aspergillus lentulus]|uniref:Uncharacterized protein n=1 Tax=Aspergillus lentulus TaxID=293939 RepID=A0AAN6BNC6_ASPLE|nr:hypothetical protein CNMCM8060_002394 [Aspergillus lentulus]KAF4181177.1 hypothetical protein CNMCM7927_000743 [Aspergillus lentulus]KAF4192564.1 hypothetical protein CNMCM8694_000175 [Aspergillus lentulus]KAF4202784.1 hypothetical protein CNMCM8927_009608 [Aspergillus lentulus]
MTTPRIEHYTTDVHAHWEGIHPQDWAEVDLIGYENAMDKMYQKLCENPDAALVQVGHRSKLLNDHGSNYRFNGKFTSEQIKPERSHHEYNHFGKLMKWEGDQGDDELWDKYFTTPGGVDAIWIQGGACISTMDFEFILAVGDNPFFNHSGFDTVQWMERFGDPGWHYHVATAKVWTLMTARLSEPSVLRRHASDYSVALRGWLNGLLMVAIQLDGAIQCSGPFPHAAKKFSAYAPSLAIYKQPWYMATERALDYEQVIPGLTNSLKSGNLTNAERWRDIAAERVNNAATLLKVTKNLSH